MKFLHKYGTRPGDIHRAKREIYFAGLIMIALAALISGLLLIKSYKGEHSVPQAGQASGINWQGTALNEMREEVASKWNAFEEKLLADSIDLEDLERLEQAIEVQRTIIQMHQGESMEQEDLSRLEEMQAGYETQMGYFLHAQSKRLEENAASLHASGQEDEAIRSLQKAGNLQRQINDDYPLSSHRNPSRLHYLDTRLTLWRTAPMAEKADTLKQEAIDLRKNRKYEAARDKIKEALEQQRTLNEQFRISPSASLARLKEFEQASKLINAAEDIDTVENLVTEAKTLLNSGSPDAALARIKEIRQLQENLQSQYPDLTEAQALTIEEIEILEDTAASVTAYKGVMAKGDACRDLLRQKRLEPFTNAVADWLRAAEQFLRMYPQSKFTDEIHIHEVRYLHGKRDNLPSLIDTVYTNLVPLKKSKVDMYRTEVPQFLYQSVTGHNPSNNRGPLLPVESITWTEAEQFTQLLSWILARPVTLPNLSHFREALGAVEAGIGEDEVWSNWSSGRKTHPVGTSPANSAGFHDLLGNVSEWLAIPEAEHKTRASLIGGSARDSLEVLLSLPVESTGTSERNRFAGFRFIVETGFQGNPEE